MARKLADTTAKKPAKKPRGKPFQKGQPSANPAGRPKGSRNKLSEDFIAALCEDFEAHGMKAIREVRENKPDAYLRVVADLVPKDLNVKHDSSELFAKIWQAVGTGKVEGMAAP